MSQWQVPSSAPAAATMNMNIIYLLLGLYGWEYIHTLDVEYAIIRGRLSFRLTLVPFIAGRIFLLIFLIVLAVGTSPFSGNILCQPSIFLISLLGDLALGCSSTIFVIRTWVIWKDSRLVHVLLLLFSLAQWAMLMTNSLTVKSIVVGGFCEVYLDRPKLNAESLLYSTCYDLLVFVLSVVGLSRQRSESPLKKRLYAQGILYFAVIGIVYIPPAVCALLGQASLMLIFCNIAVTVSTIASSRAVRSLLSLGTSASCHVPDSDPALTTQIVIQPSFTGTRESTIPGDQNCADGTEKC